MPLSPHIFTAFITLIFIIFYFYLQFPEVKQDKRWYPLLFSAAIFLFWQFLSLVSMLIFLFPANFVSLFTILWRLSYHLDLLYGPLILLFVIGIAQIKKNKLFTILIFVPNIFMLPISIFSPYILSHITISNWNYEIYSGPGYWFYATYFFIFLIAIVISLIIGIKKAKTNLRSRLIFFGLTFTALMLVSLFIFTINYFVDLRLAYLDNISFTLVLLTITALPYHLKLLPSRKRPVSIRTRVSLAFLFIALQVILAGVIAFTTTTKIAKYVEQGSYTVQTTTDLFQNPNFVLIYQGVCKQIITSLSLFLSISVLIVISSSVAVIFISRTIIKPIEELTESTEAISRGDLNLATRNTHRRDELGNLAKSFEKMRQKPKSLTEDMESTIQDQTKQLEKDLLQEEKTTEAMIYILERSQKANAQIKKHQRELKERNLILNQQKEEILHQQEKLQKANQELAKLDQLKSDFISNVNHELRTPLTSIRMYNQLLLDGDLGKINPQQQQALTEIISASDHLLQLINEILEVKKIEEGRMEFHYELVDLKQLLNTVQINLKGILHQEKIKLITKVSSQLPPLNIDKTKFIEVFTNLIGNALKFNKNHNPITIKANLVKKQHENIVQIEIIDKGIGIKPDKIKHLFDKFYQIEEAVSKKTPGTGLGLALTKEIIDAHGGVISVESVHGQGTTFTIHLPINFTPTKN